MNVACELCLLVSRDGDALHASKSAARVDVVATDAEVDSIMQAMSMKSGRISHVSYYHVSRVDTVK